MFRNKGSSSWSFSINCLKLFYAKLKIAAEKILPSSGVQLYQESPRFIVIVH